MSETDDGRTVRHIAAERRDRWRTGPHAVVLIPWRHRDLLAQLVRRQLEAEFRGSLIGGVWVLLNPILMLLVYTFVFSVVFQVRWDVAIGGRADFAMILYVGLIALKFFNDAMNQAPGLIRANPSYVKKVVFPVEIVPLVPLGGGLVHMLFGGLILTAAHLLFVGPPPWTAVFLPVIVLPLVLVAAGGVWVLASLGMFLRDIGQVVQFLTTMLFFLSPVFYPVSALPERFQAVIYLNPMTVIIEEARKAFLYGQVPDFALLGAYAVVAWLVAWLGLAWFRATRHAFADMV